MPYISNRNAPHTATALGGHNEKRLVRLHSWRPQEKDTVVWERHEEWVSFPALEMLIPYSSQLKRIQTGPCGNTCPTAVSGVLFFG